MDVETRFWAQVEVTPSCWNWRGKLDKGGYGRFYMNGRGWRAHQASLLLLRDINPLGKHAHHLCENRSCVNPDHLEVMEPAAHIRFHRGDVCSRGHPREGENVYLRQKGRWIIRECRSCRRLINGQKPRQKYWTRERVVQAIQLWASIHDGVPPSATDWNIKKELRGAEYPSINLVYGKTIGSWEPAFSKWADAIESAGFPRPSVGRRPKSK